MPSPGSDTAEKEILATAGEKPEKLIKEGKSVEVALQETRDEITKIAEAARDKIGDDKEYRKRIDAAITGAEATFEIESEVYKKIEAFVQRAVEVELVMVSNEDAYKKMEGGTDLKAAGLFSRMANGLVDLYTQLDNMDAPGMKAEKDELLERLNRQSKKFSDEAQNIAVEVAAEMAKQDRLLAQVAKGLDTAHNKKDDKKYAALLLDLTTEKYLLLNTHLGYLNTIKEQASTFPEVSSLMLNFGGNLDAKIGEFEQVLDNMQATLGAYKPDWEKAAMEYEKQQELFTAAEKNLRKVSDAKGDSNYKNKLADAEGRLAGCQNALDKASQALRQVEMPQQYDFDKVVKALTPDDKKWLTRQMLAMDKAVTAARDARLFAWQLEAAAAAAKDSAEDAQKNAIRAATKRNDLWNASGAATQDLNKVQEEAETAKEQAAAAKAAAAKAAAEAAAAKTEAETAEAAAANAKTAFANGTWRMMAIDHGFEGYDSRREGYEPITDAQSDTLRAKLNIPSSPQLPSITS